MEKFMSRSLDIFLFVILMAIIIAAFVVPMVLISQQNTVSADDGMKYPEWEKVGEQMSQMKFDNGDRCYLYISRISAQMECDFKPQ